MMAADHYRAEAARLRHLAAVVRNEVIRDSYLQTATEYDKLALKAEKATHQGRAG